jgi:long-chain acyl-CoA synthetase
MTTLSLAVLLAESAKRTPDRVAVVEGDLRLTYGELWADVLQRAGELAEAGVRPGTRVALLAPNVADFVRSYYAILAAGGVVVPVPTLLSGDEAAHIVATSGAKLLVCDTACAQLGEAVVAARPDRRGPRRCARTHTAVPTTPRSSSTPAAPPAGPRARS